MPRRFLIAIRFRWKASLEMTINFKTCQGLTQSQPLTLKLKLKTFKLETINNMKILKNISLALLVIIGLTFSLDGIAQAPPPPPPGHGSTGNQSGGNAPIGGGFYLNWFRCCVWSKKIISIS